MLRSLYLLIVLLSFSSLKSQCFQIQSILVDACAGSQEGQNEMVRFQVGSTALNTSNLSVNWPNNSWLGLTKNASTANSVTSVNATINGCGFLKEPTANILPANAKVLLVTSTAWSPLAQSFANLTDTLYIIFQTAGNTNGHFANYQSGGGLRTLSMSFSSPAGCNDAVTYDRALLVNQSGNVGAQDGATVEFTPAGAATYVNHGCQAPFTPLTVDAGLNKTICIGASQTFTAIASGPYSSVYWSLGAGASGSFAPTNSLSTTYTPSTGESGTVKLYCNIIKSCGSQTTTVRDSVNLTINAAPSVTVTPNNISLCNGQSATVQASSNSTATYSWSTGAITNSVSLNTAGIYTVSASNSCGNSSATVSISISSAPTLTIISSSNQICASGQTATLSLVGSTGTYTWSTGVNTPTVSINSPGVYSATVSAPGCGNAVASISLTSASLPVISITPIVSNTLCSGGSVILTATSNEGNYLWSNGATTNTVSVNTASITVTSTNACGTSQASQTLNIIATPTVIVSPTASVICSSSTSITITATSNASNYIWSTGDATNSIVVNTPGIKTVSVSNACGTATASTTITSITLTPLVLTTTSNTICPNETATLTVSGSEPLNSGGSVLYSWSNSSSTNSVVTTNGGIITVSNTSACGTNTASININVVNINANISANPLTGVPPLVVNFTNNSSGANSYSWAFGNGNTANTQTVTSQTYYTAGNYIVYLLVSDGTCSDIDSLTVVVSEEGPTLYVPNAFTPNGDSINDIFNVGATNIKEYAIIIFDRWGLKLFSSSDIQHGWDGKVNGNVVSDGTYFFLINAVGNDNVEIRKQGVVTLFK